MLIKTKYIALIISAIFLHSCSLFAAENSKYYSLQQAIDYALANNPDLLIMQDRIGQAEARLGLAMANFYPQFKARLSYEHSNNPSRAFGMIISQRRLSFTGTDFNHPGGTDNYRPEVTASYSLFRGGQDYFTSKAAESGVEAAMLDQSATRNRLIQMVSSTYYVYLAAIEAHKTAKRSVVAVSSELEHSRIRYDAGSTLKSDVLSLEVHLAEAEDQLIQSANAIELIRTSLKTLLGLDIKAPLYIEELNNQGQNEQQNTADFTTLLDQAIAQRPEINAAIKRLDMVTSQLTAAKGAYLPKADAYVSYGSDSKNLDFSTSRDNVTAGVMLEMDIFSGFSRKEKIKKIEHQLSETKRTLTRIRLQIENEVKTAYLKLQEAMARLNVTAASVLAAEEVLRMVKDQRNAGTVTVTRYIEAEVARDKAHSRRIAAQFDALRAEAQLNQAIGLWK